MSVKAYSREQIEEMSMIEIAYEILKEEKTTFTYLDLLKKVADLKQILQLSYRRGDSNPHWISLQTDFESVVSTNSTTSAIF